MKKNKVFLLLNGEPPKKLPDLSKYDIICATDGAYKFLEQKKICPDFVAGDFDSLQTIPKNTEIVNTPNQDFTDFEKTLSILYNRRYTDIYGASGKEQDHFLGNLHTAISWKEKLKLTFFDNYNSYFLAKNETKITNCLHKTISLIPFPKADHVQTKGLKYPLHSETLLFGERIGTRNKVVSNNVLINFKSGNLFIFISNK